MIHNRIKPTTFILYNLDLRTLNICTTWKCLPFSHGMINNSDYKSDQDYIIGIGHYAWRINE